MHESENRAPDIPKDSGCVVTPILRGPQKESRRREPPPTDAEMEEYRRIRPRLLKMLDEWDRMTGPLGCPVANVILPRP